METGRKDTAGVPSAIHLWSTASRGAMAAGAIESLACTLYAGRHNHSVVLPVLFAVWVLSPYAGMYGAWRVAQRSPRGIATAMHASMIALALFAVVLYAAVTFGLPIQEKAAPFLAVPAAMWLAVGSMVAAARWGRRRWASSSR